MLPKAWRLVSPSHFSFTYRRGHKLHTPAVSLCIVEQLKSVENTKFAVVVSKQISKKAVDRNLYRRQILAIISQILTKIPPVGYLFVFTVNNRIKDFSYKQLKDCVLQLLRPVIKK